MTGTTWAVLRELLADRYEDFRIRLTRRFGSDLASESLNETWLHLHRQGDAGPMQSPPAFLMRVATNIARDRLRSERRRLRRSEMKEALEIADSAPGPAQEVEARLDLGLVQQAIRELPERTRMILVAARFEGAAHNTIAQRLGISRRTVFYELKRAMEHLDARLENNDPSDCTGSAGETS